MYVCSLIIKRYYFLFNPDSQRELFAALFEETLPLGTQQANI
jgi:hypothetical protein